METNKRNKTQLLPIEKEELSEAGILDELKQTLNKQLKYWISVAADMNDLRVEMGLEAVNEFTGLSVFGASGRLILTARYTYAEDRYQMTGLNIADTSLGSPATAVVNAILNDRDVKRAVADALSVYECAAALYRYKA